MMSFDRSLFISVALSALAISSQATAQDETSAAGSADSTEIVVTANKRAQAINDVPMSITALSGDALTDAGINGIQGLERVTPGFSFAKTHDSVPVLTIRGVGYYDNSIGAAPTVSAYADEIPLPYPVMTSGAILDLERVEVLKGPQGTLFGQNSTGGALNFIAAKPRDHFEGALSVGYGSFNTIETTGFVTGPLAEGLNVRLAGRYENASPWQKSLTGDDRLGRIDRGGARLLIDWDAAPMLRFHLATEAWFDKSDPQAAQLVGLAINVPGLQNPALASGDGSPGNPLVQTYPAAPSKPRVADWSPGDYAANHLFYRGSLRTEIDLSSAVTLTSLSSYQHMDYRNHVDPDGTALAIADLRTDGDLEAFYQELRIGGRSGPLQWLVGGNYARNNVSALNPPVFTDWSVPLGNIVINTITRSRTLAAYANVEYALTDTVAIQGGVRYTDERQRYRGCPRDSGDGIAAAVLNFLRGTDNLVPGGCYSLDDLSGSFAPAEANLRLKEDNISWRVGLTFEPNADTMIYANVSRGYKSGAFTLAVFDLLSQAEPARQESLTAYEGGLKIGGRAFQINLAGFYYDYRDKQVNAPFDTGGPFGVLDKLLNIPRSRILGAEVQATLRPSTAFRFTFNGSYIDSKVLSNFVGTSPFGGPLNLKGLAFPYTPKVQIATDAEYRVPITSEWTGKLGASLTFRSDSSGRFGGGQLYDIPDYALVDLRAGIESDDGRWAFDVWGRNIFNTYYRVNTTSFVDTVAAFTGPPATYGVRGTVRF